MADMLIEQDRLDTIVLVPISVGGNRIEDWTRGGVRHRRLQVAIKRARDQGLAFTDALWHPGEDNAGDDADPNLYTNCFMNIHGRDGPVYVAQATICRSPPNETIRSAQRAVVDPMLGVFAGPNTDIIGSEHRYDGCHMAHSGLNIHAKLWVGAPNFARSILRHIRVTSKHELKERIMAGIDHVNRYPIVHTWSYRLADAA